MKLYLVTRTDMYGLDEYNSIICSTRNKKSAKNLFKTKGVKKKNMKVEKIGKSKVNIIGVVMASFNAA